MQQQVTLTKIVRKDKDKEGNDLKTKDGRPYTRVAIQTNEHGQKWLTGFENPQNARWQEGDTVEIEVEEKGEYLNFKSVSQVQMLWNAVKELQSRMTGVEEFIKGDKTVDVNEELALAEQKEEIPW